MAKDYKLLFRLSEKENKKLALDIKQLRQVNNELNCHDNMTKNLI